MSAPTPNTPLPPLRPYADGLEDGDIRLPNIGEVTMIRLPFDMPGPTSIISSSAISGSNNRNYHPCVVIGLSMESGCWEVKVYVCRSFSSESDPVSYVNSLPPAQYDQLLPLPYRGHPFSNTPAGFGTPLSFSDYLPQKPAWLIAKPTFVYMGGNSPYKPFQPQTSLPRTELGRIETYFNSLAAGSVTSTTLPPSVGGAGFGAAEGPGGRDTAGVADTNSSGPIHGTTQSRMPPSRAGQFVIQALQEDSDDDDDMSSSEPYLSLHDFLRAPTIEAYWAALTERRDAERRSVVEDWLSGI